MGKGPGGGKAQGWRDDGSAALIWRGVIVAVLIIGGLTFWAGRTQLEGAVVAAGELGVDGNSKAIQHLEGGIVAEVLVREGDLVAPGDLLLRLDDTSIRAAYDQMDAKLVAALAQRDRLIAERDGLDEIVFDPFLVARLDEPRVREHMQGQQDSFRARRSSRNAEIDVQRQRELQIDERTGGLRARRVNLLRQIELLGQERDACVELGEFCAKLRVVQVDRQAAALRGELATLDAEIAEAAEAIAEIRLEIIRLTEGAREDFEDDLRSREAEISEARLELVALEDRLNRTRVRAPHAGRVLGLSVFNAGAVARPGDDLMAIVPVDEQLVVKSRVRPQDIDRVNAGQPARLVFSGLGGASAPEVPAEVVSVSADALQDPNGRESYFEAVLRFDPQAESIASYGLTPGMPVEAFIRTSGQSVLAYLVRPLSDNFERTFIEE